MKTKDTTPKAPATITTATGIIPSLAEITKMTEADRIGLYRTCDEQMRSRFLIQGKIIHSLGDKGEEALRKAGVPSSSLSTARMAAIALSLTTFKEEGKKVMLHIGDTKKEKPVPFTEEVYDQLTLERCRLLTTAFTARGNAKHRTAPETAMAIVKKHGWEAELECYFEEGMSLEMKTVMGKEAAKRAEALQALTPTTIPTVESGATETDVPAAPQIVSAPPPKAPEATTTSTAEPVEPTGETSEGETPPNVVSASFTPPLAEEEEDQGEQEAPQATGFGVDALMMEVEALKTMIPDLATDVTTADCQAIAGMLREIASQLETIALQRHTPEAQVATAATGKDKTKKAGKKPDKAKKVA